MLRHVSLKTSLLAALLLPAPLFAQEHKELGKMWTFENAPLDFFEAEYGFRPSKEWLEHVRLSSIRYGGGCSASFVSPRGLILTNHHCARDNVVSVSPAGQDWLVDGYQAKTLDQEVQVPGLTVQQLVATRDVTKEMNEGLTNDLDEEQIAAKLAENEAKILEAAQAESDEYTYELKTLYQGGNFQLYTFKIYDDVRLVAVPHMQAAKFGGDPDNFTFPRFSLDFAIMRAWEDGKPANTEAHYLEWRTEGPKDGETVFVSGSPGSTGRLLTIAQIEFLRDIELPRILQIIKMRTDALMQRIANAPKEQSSALEDERLGLENARKAYTGYLDGLLDEKNVDVKREAEKRVLDRINSDPELKAEYGGLWDKMAEVQQLKRDAFKNQSQAQLNEANAREEVLAKRLGDAYFAAYGFAIPPDATFSLRLSDGRIAGYEMNGTVAPYFTTLYGMFARHHEFEKKPPFHLPQEWIDAESKLDLTTPFCHVSTCDITGGNSGSPMVDAQGRLVGLVFDGNIESLGNNYIFTDTVARTVSVHPAIIIESLRKIYDSNKLADELEGKGKGY